MTKTGAPQVHQLFPDDRQKAEVMKFVHKADKKGLRLYCDEKHYELEKRGIDSAFAYYCIEFQFYKQLNP